MKSLLSERKIRLELSKASLEKLAKDGFDPQYGARPLKRVIQRELQNSLAKALLEGQYREGDVIHVEVEKGEFSYSKRVPKEAATG